MNKQILGILEEYKKKTQEQARSIADTVEDMARKGMDEDEIASYLGHALSIPLGKLPDINTYKICFALAALAVKLKGQPRNEDTRTE